MNSFPILETINQSYHKENNRRQND